MDNGASSYRRFLDGDESAFDEIMKEYFDNLVFFIDRFVHDIHTAEDIAIDAFSDLVVNKHRYNFKVTLKTYLFMLGRSRALNYIKHRKVIDFVELSEVDNTPAEQETLEEIVLADAEENLVIKAYNLLREKYALAPVDIHLYKHIPMGAGLGGGSADCAFMIKVLNEKFRLGLSIEEMENYAARLGADCAFFIQNQPVFATGIGNVFERIRLSLANYKLVLVKPDISVSTKEAYAHIQPKHPEVSLKEIVQQPVETWASCMKNDFEDSVFQLYPEIAAIKDKMYDLGAVYASMSGSGSAVFGIFKEAIENVDEKFAGCFCRQREMI